MMNKQTMLRALVALVLFTGVAAAAAGEELTVQMVVQGVLESDTGVRSSQNRVLQAQERYRLALTGTQPRLDLEVRPYSRDQRRVPGGTDGRTVDTVTQSVGAGLQLTQRLPTSGVLSAGLDYGIELQGGDAATEWRQVPQVSFSWNQPLFGGGELIGTRVFQAGLRNTEIGLELARLQDRQSRNGVIREALQLFVQVANLRSTVELLEATIALLGEQLASAELDRQQGLISDTALLSLQVTLNGRREALFSTQLQLLQVEQLLARTIGRNTLEGEQLAGELPAVDLAVDLSGIEGAAGLTEVVQENPVLGSRELAIEQAERTITVNSAADRPSLTVFARAQPVYSSVRPERDSFGASFPDLFADDAGVQSTLGVTLTVPLLTGQQREYRQRIDELSRQSAVLERSDAERVLANQLRTLLTSRRFLEQRLGLIDTDLSYERQRVANEQTLLDAGVSTELRLREVRLDLRSRENERQRVTGELFLNSLEILTVLGDDLAARVAP